MQKLFPFLVMGLCAFTEAFGQQKMYRLTFNGDDWTPAYAHTDYSLRNSKGVLSISGTAIGSDWQNIKGAMPETDLSSLPVVYVKIRTSVETRFELRLIDGNGKETNDNNPKLTISPDQAFRWIQFDYTNKFVQSWPNAGSVSQIVSAFSILLNGGGNPNFNGVLEIDEVIFGDSTTTVPPYDPVVHAPKVNQVGYATKGAKVAVFPSTEAKRFYLIEEQSGDTLLSKMSMPPAVWPYSEESVAKADFSEIETQGQYRLHIQGLAPSSEFCIGDTAHEYLLYAAAKAFYYNRASSPIESPWGGKWTRAAGHPDGKVVIHPSAATAQKPAGTEIAAPKGWYDAGDYNKYVVPAGIATWQVLASYSYFLKDLEPLSLYIPESSNALPDMLDEALWEIDWLRSMQDPDDGGVYHKLSNASFDATIMPDKATTTRYVLQKSTPAALNFAALLAKSSGIFSQYPEMGSEYANGCLQQAELAWDWASTHPNAQYDQESLNQTFDPDITTGDYGLQSYNIDWSDEWFWAATELYLATGKQKYLDKLHFVTSPAEVPKWSAVEFMGVLTMLHNPDRFPTSFLQQAKERLLGFAKTLKTECQRSAYGISLGASAEEFSWNSNGNALNHAMLLFEAYRLTGEQEYLACATADIDYVLGRNPLNMCFVTGQGTQSPLKVHHRISSADGITEPVPGLLVNGPHNTYLNSCFYSSTIPAFTYLDNECSSATNEPGIYQYSALVYALSAEKFFRRTTSLGIKEEEMTQSTTIHPNPNRGSFELRTTPALRAGTWTLMKAEGTIVSTGTLSEADTQLLSLNEVSPGFYILLLSKEARQVSKRVIVY